MYISTPSVGYWLSEANVKTVETGYNAKYLGPWTIKDRSGNWTNYPVDVFYVESPDTSKGHSNYFGLFKKGDSLMICDASSAFSEPIVGLLAENNEVLISRYRHDYVKKGEVFVDGGREYLRRSAGKMVEVNVYCGEFNFGDVNE